MRTIEADRAGATAERAPRAAPAPSVRLLVCGTTGRGDEGAALIAVATLLPALPPEVLAALEVRRCPVLDVDDLTVIPPGVAAIVIDAAIGPPPRVVEVLPLEALAVPDPVARPSSSRARPVDRLIATTAYLRGRLPRGAFVAIGGGRFTFGGHLSRAVRAALPAFRGAIEREIRRALAEPSTEGRMDRADGLAVPATARPAAGTLMA